MSGPVGLNCPGCGVHAALVLPGQSAAFCANEDCRIFKWDPALTLEGCMANMGFIRLLQDDPSPEQGKGDP